jgi:predicted PP-loop superfamily ATPase
MSSQFERDIKSYGALNLKQRHFFETIEQYLLKRPLQKNQISLLSQDIQQRLGCNSSLKNKTVLFAFGGGKDSTYACAIIRYIQLLFRLTINTSFNLRIVTNLQGGINVDVTTAIEKVFCFLDLNDDQDVEIVLVINGKSYPYANISSYATFYSKAWGREILVRGHTNYGLDGRALFCDICNTKMLESFQVAISSTKSLDADLMITGDSFEEMRSYYRWTKKVSTALSDNEWKKVSSFHDFAKRVAQLSKQVNWGVTSDGESQEIEIDNKKNINFLSIYSYLDYSTADRLTLLEKLGLEFNEDNFAISLSETDCINPLIMAHIYALSLANWCKYFLNTAKHFSYEEIIKKYFDQFSLYLMQIKEFPTELIEINKSRFSSYKKILQTRETIEFLLFEHYGISPNNIEMMIWAPFTEKGRNTDKLKDFLKSKNKSFIDLDSYIAENSGLNFKEIAKLNSEKLVEPVFGINSEEVFINLKLSPDKQHKFRIYDPHKKPIKISENLYFLAAGR